MTDNIKPEHYRKGEIDLYEAFSKIFPHNEYRAGMQMIAMRYMFRDKNDRVEDLGKAIETLERLREKEIEYRKKQETENSGKMFEEAFAAISEVLGGDFKAFEIESEGQHLHNTYFDRERLLKKLIENDYKYLARDEDGELFAYSVEPEKDVDIWNTALNECAFVKDDIFTEVQWSDNEPTKISDLLGKL